MALPIPALIAHRGASQDTPENTLAAIELAWQQQADALEVDIRLTRDNQIVLMHDATARRTAGLDRPIAELTLAELRELDAGSWKAPQYAGERIPTLTKALAAVPADKRIFIEIKCGPEVLPQLETILAASKLTPENLVLIGFNLETMREAKHRLPTIPGLLLAALSEDLIHGDWRPKITDLIHQSKSAHLDGLDLGAGTVFDAAPMIQTVKTAGQQFYAWTVNDPAMASALAKAGVDGITTDCPGKLRAALTEG